MVVVAGVLGSSCRQQDVRTFDINVPGMHNQACADVILRAINGVQGVRGAQTRVDLSARKLAVTYDSLILSRKNIEFAIADAGFAANEVPANVEAMKNLPPECMKTVVTAAP